MTFSLINGDARGSVDCRDRGLNYGDGVFETMRARSGSIRLLPYHLERLSAGLRALAIRPPPARTLRRELDRAARRIGEGVVKLVVTRGVGERGYRATGAEHTVRIVTATAGSQVAALGEEPSRLRICETRLSEQPALAGIKSLNRLDSVLARSEWRDPKIFDGLMRDSSGNLVCGTMSNLFVRHGEVLLTPALERCGVRGVMRRWVMENAVAVALKMVERPIVWSDLRAASEVFMSNALVGVKSIKAVEWRARKRQVRFGHFEAARRLRERLNRL